MRIQSKQFNKGFSDCNEHFVSSRSLFESLFFTEIKHFSRQNTV